MELYLLRHADADTAALSDDARRLSDKGVAQAGKVARFCEAHQISPEVVLSSPVRRAHETAQIVCAHLRRELKICRWLACGMTPVAALEGLQEYAMLESAMIVGHEPDFSQLVAHLIGTPDGEHIRVRKASLTSLELPVLAASGGLLQFSVPCRFM